MVLFSITYSHKCEIDQAKIIYAIYGESVGFVVGDVVGPAVGVDAVGNSQNMVVTSAKLSISSHLHFPLAKPLVICKSHEHVLKS